MYDAIGVPLTADAESAMRRWLVERPRELGRARPTPPETYGLSDAQIDDRFAAYNARFRSDAAPFEEELMSEHQVTRWRRQRSTSRSWRRWTSPSTRRCKAAYRSVAETWLGRAKAVGRDARAFRRLRSPR